MQYNKQKTVPDTTGDQNASAAQLDTNSLNITAYLSLFAIGDTVFFLQAESAPTCAAVIANGAPIIEGAHVSLQPVQVEGQSTVAPDPSRIWLAKATPGTGDVRACA